MKTITVRDDLSNCKQMQIYTAAEVATSTGTD